MSLGRQSFNKKRRAGRASGVDRRVLVFAGALAVVLISSVAVVLHLTSSPSDAAVKPEVQPAQPQMSEILVPAETIQVGASFQPAMFRRELRSEGRITGDMIRSFDELKGLYAKGVLIKDQPILKAALTNRQPIHILTALLPKNYRAVAIQVETPWIDNVDGWAQPGTDVDLVWITNIYGPETASILAGPVRILAANKTTEWTQAKKADSAPKLTTVSLLLSVRDAIRVSLAQRHGKISLGLRGVADQRPNEATKPISSISEEPVSSQPAQKIHSVKVVDSGSQVAEVRKYDSAGRRLEQ